MNFFIKDAVYNFLLSSQISIAMGKIKDVIEIIDVFPEIQNIVMMATSTELIQHPKSRSITRSEITIRVMERIFSKLQLS